MGIGAAAVKIIEESEERLRAGHGAEVRVWYDMEHAEGGIASGNALLIFRVQNAWTRAIQAVPIRVVHPLTQVRIDLPIVTTLNANAVKDTLARTNLERGAGLAGAQGRP